MLPSLLPFIFAWPVFVAFVVGRRIRYFFTGRNVIPVLFYYFITTIGSKHDLDLFHFQIAPTLSTGIGR